MADLSPFPPLANNVLEDIKLINQKVLSKDASTYELENFKRNILIIFNQKEFKDRPNRVGTEKDAKALEETFTKFGFKVTEHKDLIEDEIFATLDKLTDCKEDLSEYGCIAVAILTHGNESGLRAKDGLYSEEKLINHFKCCNNQTLHTKPVVIIIQACRGNLVQPAANLHDSGTTSKDVNEYHKQSSLKAPDDMIILHSCYAGSSSYRNDLYGSWFIQELCKKIKCLARTQDLESIMTEVKREVAINRQFEDKGSSQTNINKQMPIITSGLSKKLYLRKFGEVTLRLQCSVDESERDLNSSEFKSEKLDCGASTVEISIQKEPGTTFKELHFNFLKMCLMTFMEQNPDDKTAKAYWDLAVTYKDMEEFIQSKHEFSKVILDHLFRNTNKFTPNKIVHLYKE